MENFLEKVRMHRLLLSGIGGVMLSVIMMFVITPVTALFMVPCAGLLGSLVMVGFGTYHSIVQEYANRHIENTPLSFKQELKILRKQRMELCKKMYEYKGYKSDREDYAKKIRKIDDQIAVHRGLKPELESTGKPATSRW